MHRSSATRSNFQADSGPVSARGVTLGAEGILIAPTSTLTDTGDWTGNGGIFEPNNGTVVLAGTNQVINGSTNFFNLTRLAGNGGKLTFQADTTQTIFGMLNLQGAPGKPLLLRSSVPGTQWSLDAEGLVSLAYLDVQDSENVGPTTLQFTLHQGFR